MKHGVIEWMFRGLFGIALAVSVMGTSAATPVSAAESLEHVIETRTIIGPQGELALYLFGEGVALPVLFLHADSGRASQWTTILPRIGSNRRVFALDARGSGNSTPAENGDYSYEGRAQDIEAFAESLEIDQFVIVAHSGSGAAALQYAGRNPDKVAGLFLLDPPTDPRSLPTAVRDGFLNALKSKQGLQVQQEYYSSIAGTRPSTREQVIADCITVTSEARYGFAKAFAEWDPETALKAWSGPTFLLVSSANDTKDALYRLRPSLPYAVVENTGHWIQLDRPDVVEQEIENFLTTIEGLQD